MMALFCLSAVSQQAQYQSPSWKVTRYIYLGTGFKCYLEVLILYSSISIFYCFILLLFYNSEAVLSVGRAMVHLTHLMQRLTASTDSKHEQVSELLSSFGILWGVEMPGMTHKLYVYYFPFRTGWVSLATSHPLTQWPGSFRPRRPWPRPSKPCRSSEGWRRPECLVCCRVAVEIRGLYERVGSLEG